MCISGVDKEEIGWVEIEITIDSGACDAVLPSRMLQHIDISPSADSKMGMEDEVANGKPTRLAGAHAGGQAREQAVRWRWRPERHRWLSFFWV